MEHEAKERAARRVTREQKDRKNAAARAKRAALRKAADDIGRASGRIATDAALIEAGPAMTDTVADPAEYLPAPPVPCPFCLKLFPGVAGQPGVSVLRVDNKTLICADCGTREALEGGLRMPVWQFLESYGSHDIYLADITARKFLAYTGRKAPWVPHSAATIRAMIAERGLGGHYDSSQPAIAGYEMTVACAWEFARFHSVKNGRGAIQRECIEALRGNGI